MIDPIRRVIPPGRDLFPVSPVRPSRIEEREREQRRREREQEARDRAREERERDRRRTPREGDDGDDERPRIDVIA